MACLFSRSEGKAKLWHHFPSSLLRSRTLWGVCQKLPTPPGKLEPFTGFLDYQALISFALSMHHFSEPVSIYVSFLCALVLNQSALSFGNPQLFALGKSVWAWFWLFLRFYHYLFSVPEGTSTCSSLARSPSWLWTPEEKGVQVHFQQSYPMDGFLSESVNKVYWSRDLFIFLIPQEIKISNMFCFKMSRARSSSDVN